ncbi:hypothetical protein [Dysgonomonas massiliensis]|uniref:hypothetical protein n=1 Tax=Dysgonomonas massiliensis TaxID=2040292 RepID=UPI000C763320|nr:hypothetical protein [Dysgonomonas massiliensis]
MSIIIKEIHSADRALLKAFVKYPIDVLYKDCPYFVPPLVMDMLDTLDDKKNPAFEFCEMQLFLAYRDSKIVGRIGAIINHKANEAWNEKTGRFGFVDFIDDNEVVDALFDAAQKWVLAKGMNAIVGPMGFCDLDPQGLLVEGYDRVSTMATVYSYPYYKEQIERIGFAKEVDWKEFLIRVPEETPERHRRIANMVSQRYGLKVHKFKSYEEIKPRVRDVFNLLNIAYKPLFGFSELSEKQIEHIVKTYVPILNWNLITLVIKEDTDELVGFGLGMPNMSQALIKSRGRLFPTGWFHLLKSLKGKSNKLADLLLMGISPEYQGKGVNAMVFNDFIPSTRKSGFEFVESNPELEMNNKMVSLWDGFDAQQHKTRRAYKKQLV